MAGVGVVGLGLLDSAVAGRLRAAGREVIGYDVVADDVATRHAQTTGHRGAEETETDDADGADGRHAAQQALQGG